MQKEMANVKKKVHKESKRKNKQEGVKILNQDFKGSKK